MAYKRRYKPNKAEAREFAALMRKIEDFCLDHGIQRSMRSDSYYFVLNGQNYRVSNHSVEASNRSAYDDFGNLKRELYHQNGREDYVVYIHASKTRIMDIYNDLAAGFILDGRGNRKAVLE